MAIDKITPNRLDRSSDFKLIPKTSMVDALNMIVTEDSANTTGDNIGDLGVLKNVKGNSAMSYASPSDAIVDGEAKIIGSVTDTKLKIVYFFVWHDDPNEHGVWAYDPRGKLPGGGAYTNAIRKIHKSSLYNFPQHGFVKGDLIYTSQSRLNQGPGGPVKAGTEKDFEKDTILYFTDNTNEPKKLNVSMALINADAEYNDTDLIDFITACPKTPLIPITFNFQSDPTVTTSNFKTGPGFQFAYQAIYKDGVESAISPYSDIAFSPGIINQGSNPSVNHITHNMCVLTIPSLGEEISEIKILARQFNNPELVILDQIENVNPNTQTQYNFYNDRIVKGVSTNEVNKQFDNLPRKAQAQSIVDNRLMYGNYLEGFDNIKTQCSATVSFKERESEMVDFTLKLVHAVSEQKRAHIQEHTGDTPEGIAINKSAGYILDASELPDHINPGTTINVSISVAPNQNFHIYQAAYSYHQSRHKGGFNQYLEDSIDYSDPDSYNGSPWGLPNEDGTITEPYGHQSLDDSGATWLAETIDTLGTNTSVGQFEQQLHGVPFSGNNFGVGGAGGLGDIGGINGGQGFGAMAPVWKTELGASTGTSVPVKYGTSAANPLIIKGNTLIFSCSFTMGGSSGAGKDAIISIVSQLLGGIEPTWGGGVETGFLTIHDVQRTFSYDIDLEVNNGDKFVEGSPVTKLITAAMPKTETYDPYDTPVGCFVVNKAKVTFGLERDEFFRETTGSHQMLRLVVEKIENVDLVTMVKKMWPGQPWQAITREYLTQGDFSEFNDIFETEAVYDTSESSNIEEGWHPPLLNTIDDFSYDYETSLPFWGGFGNIHIEEFFISGGFGSEPHAQAGYAELQSQRFFGYLDFNQDTEGLENFFRYNRDVYSETPLNQGESETFPFSLLDGESGPGGLVGQDSIGIYSDYGSLTSFTTSFSGQEGTTAGAQKAISYLSPYGFSSVPRVIAILKFGGGAYYLNTGGVLFLGTITTNTSLIESVNPDSSDPRVLFGGFFSRYRSYLPFIQGQYSGQFSDNLDSADEPDKIYQNAGDFNVDWTEKQPHVEVLDTTFSYLEGANLIEGGFYDRTFKSSANHDFGIIYYDERGRHGFVNHLTTVYVPGYSQQERGGPLYGRSEITLNIEHPAPDWAHFYKIAYTKNTSVEKFIQYTAGGAFIEQIDDEAVIESGKIYVSLNYLQESGISYVTSWGARDPEGGLSMFKKIEGRNQKLRIISAENYSGNRIYYYNYEFDIVDVVLLGSTDNPLVSDGDAITRPDLQGEFVIIKNNPAAVNFDFASLSDDNNLSYWNNNCIIELYTPSKFQEEDERFYYEIGNTYAIDSPGTSNASHSQQNITLTKGDVWWRKVPVNLREYNSDTGLHEDLIQYDSQNPNASSSNFKSYYLETEAASDLFKADASLIGRPNIIVEDAVETIREASITYSGQSNPNSRKINYSSFNLTLSNYKDLQEEFGDINYMCNISGDVFVIQSDKCSLVPASKTLFSDVSGADTVVASTSPLGQESVISGRAGCDNNPESAVQVGSVVYFAHKTLGTIFRFAPQEGIQEISDLGMASYFRNLFKRALESSNDPNYQDIRVVGGYDPVNDEYLLTVLYELTVEESIPDVVVDDPYVGDVDDVDDSEGDVMVSDEICAEFVVSQTSVNNNLQPGDPVSIQFTITNVGQGIGALASSQFNSFPFEADESMDTEGTGFLGALYGNFLQITEAALFSDLYEDDELIVFDPPVTYEYPYGSYPESIFDQDPNLNPDLGDSIAALAGQYPTSVLASPNQLPVLWPGASMTLTINGIVPPDATPQTQYNIQFNFMSFDMERFEAGYALNPDFSIGGSTKFFALQDCYTQSEVMTINLNVIETETVDTTTYNADLTGDGFVGSQDLVELLSTFGDIGDNLPGDINNDGVVNIQDLLLLLNQFGGEAPNITDVIDVPTLNLDAFANAVINLSSQGQYGTTPIDLDSINTYADFLFAVPEGAINAILINQFSEVWSFIEGESATINVLIQVYFVDENGDFIPYVSGETVSEAPPLDLCSYSSLQAPDGQINVDTVLGAYAILGQQGFIEQFPIYVQQHIAAIEQSTGADLVSIFISEYLTNEDGSVAQIQCNVEGGYGGG